MPMRKERTGNLNKKDISGKRFERLIAIRQTEYRGSPGTTVWECRCDCGKIAFYSLSEPNSGNAKSCGCLFRETCKDCSKKRADLVDETTLSYLLAAKKYDPIIQAEIQASTLIQRLGNGWHIYLIRRNVIILECFRMLMML